MKIHNVNIDEPIIVVPKSTITEIFKSIRKLRNAKSDYIITRNIAGKFYKQEDVELILNHIECLLMEECQ